MTFKYHFIPQGAKADHDPKENAFKVEYNAGTRDLPNLVTLKLPADQTVILDTGNALQPGIIDHHQPGCEYSNQCVASIVVQHAASYLKHCLGKETVHIVTHFIPDLDAISAVYYTQQYLERQEFSAFDGLFCEYVTMVDLGKLILDPEHPVGVASLWLSHTSHLNYKIAFTQEFNEQLLKEGLSFLREVIGITQEAENPWTTEGFEASPLLQPHCTKILEDASLYALDFQHSTTGIVELYNEETRGYDEVEVIITRDAKSFLWKYWVRGDTKNTLFKRGFILTCLHYPTKSIISVPSNTHYNIKGLGIYIDALDIKAQLKNCTEEELAASITQLVKGTEGVPRVGFHRNDPWYDGRGAHNFTIIDAPKVGSKLREETINAAIFSYTLWGSYATMFFLESVDLTEMSELENWEKLPVLQRPYLKKTDNNRSIHAEIDAYHVRLGEAQVTRLWNGPTDHTYPLSDRSEEALKQSVESVGNKIEALLQEPANDVFLHQESIGACMLAMHEISFSRYEFLVKVRHWSVLLANYISEGFGFFHSLAFDTQKDNMLRLVEPYINPTFARTLLDRCTSLPSQSFSILFLKIEKDLKNKDLFYTLLKYQTAFPEAFSPISIEKYFLNNHDLSCECRFLLQGIAYENWDEPFFEAIPLYSYNSIKNYVDDLLYLLQQENPQAMDAEQLQKFQKTDFKQVIGADLSESNNQSIEALEAFFKENKKKIIHQLFGENCRNLRLAKYDIIREVSLMKLAVKKEQETSEKETSDQNPQKHRLIKTLLELDVKSLSDKNFHEIRTYIKALETYNFAVHELGRTQAIPKRFIDELKLFEELGALEMLFGRLKRMTQLGVLAHDEAITRDDAYLLGLNNLVFQLARLISLYINFNDPDELEASLESVLENLNQLKLIQTSEDRFETFQLREQIAAFIPLISDEINLPVNDVENQIALCLKQYEALTGTDGILQKINELPRYYRQRLQDVFSGFKAYYKHRISFFRNEIKALIEESETGNEVKLQDRYITTCNQLINHSVAFDWQELKDNVDDLAHEESLVRVRNDFYNKYFYWLSLNKPEFADKLYELNSEIRFAEGKSSEAIAAIVQHLPKSPDSQITLYSLTVDFQLDHIIKHKPVNLVHNAYDFLIEFFITKYHIDNVRETLRKFSTKFPWYYTYLTNKKYLRWMFAFLILLILAAGAFDGTKYHGNLAPLPHWIHQQIGNFSFMVVSETVLLIWGLFISLSFILPILALLRYVYQRLILRVNRQENDGPDKLNFFQLIQTIEGKRSHLLYIPFVVPLLIVVLQMSSPDTILLVNKIEGVRFFSTLLLVVGLTILSVHNYVKERNSKMSSSWLIQRTEHMLWLHLIQAFIISIFVIDLILRFQVSVSDFNDDNGGLYFLGMSKFIEIKRGFIDVVVMPTFTVMITILSLFFSFFIEKIFGGGNE